MPWLNMVSQCVSKEKMLNQGQTALLYPWFCRWLPWSLQPTFSQRSVRNLCHTHLILDDGCLELLQPEIGRTLQVQFRLSSANWPLSTFSNLQSTHSGVYLPTPSAIHQSQIHCHLNLQNHCEPECV